MFIGACILIGVGMVVSRLREINDTLKKIKIGLGGEYNVRVLV